MTSRTDNDPPQENDRVWKLSDGPGTIAPVSTMQLLRHVGDERDADLELVDNPDDARPQNLLQAGRLILPRFSNVDLLMLAAALGEQGYSTRWLDLRDPRFNELDEDYDNQLTNALLPSMRARDAESALAHLRAVARGVIVNAIELADPDGYRILIDRDGTVVLNRPRVGLGDDLAAGWRRVIAG